MEVADAQEGASGGGTVAVQIMALVSRYGQEESNMFNLGRGVLMDRELAVKM